MKDGERATMPRKIIHLITGLQVGGAESMLVKLLATMDRARFDPEVISLMSGGPNREALGDLGIPVHELGMRPGLPGPGTMWRLRRLARELRPDLVQGWMYHGNLAAAWLAGQAPSRPEQIWNIRHSVDDLGDERPMTRVAIRLGARLSGRPRAIVCNSNVSLEQHAALGYRRDSLVMIPNGFDLHRFRPDSDARRAVRSELGVPEDALLVGMMARRHPMKGQDDFLRMAASVRRSRPDTCFMMAGRGVRLGVPELDRLLDEGGLEGAVRMPGSRPDAPRILAALDVFVMPSTFGEGFPNVLGEAMACGVPCVTTDVGDAAVVVGDLGSVVERGRPEALTRAVLDFLGLSGQERARLGGRCRDSIGERFALETVAGRYADLYDSSPA